MVKLLAAIAVVAALQMASAAMAEESAVRASCSEGGTVVYREDIPADAPSKRRLLIASMHPKALCVFLDPRAGGGAAVGATTAIASQMGGDDSLAAALAVIAEGKPGDPYPDSISAAVKGAPAQSVPAQKTTPNGGRPDQHFLNLAIGVYRDVSLADVMAHWKEMQAGTKILSRMTPTVNSAGGVTMVSVEGIPDEMAASLCDEAAQKGAGCLAVY